MDQMEEKLSAILSNPQLMQQVMSMAQSLGQSSPPIAQEKSPPPEHKLPDIDMNMLKKLSGFAGQSNIDRKSVV